MMRATPLLRLVLVVALACAAGCGSDANGGGDANGGPGGDVAAPAGEARKFSVTTLTGFVFDGRSGKPVPNATVTTEPATETARTNQNGFFALGVGHAFGVLTVTSSAEGFTQRQGVCVNLKPGLNTLADISLVEVGGGSAAECVPPCTGATTCVSGVCVSRCNPLCTCAERCTTEGLCEPDPDAVPAAICGTNAHPLGVGACECDLGFVAAGDGRTCVRPSEIGECPANSTPTDAGCECDPGFLPDPVRDACVPQDEIVAPDALVGSDQIVTEFPAPGPAPRGVAYDGLHLWVGDAATQRLYRLTRAGSPAGDPFDLGPDARWLRDVTYGGDALYLQLERTAAEAAPALLRFDRATGAIEALDGAFGLDVAEGIAFDGEHLSSLEVAGGQQVVKRRSADLGSNVFQTSIALDDARLTSGSYFVRSRPALYLAYTQNQYVTWVGTRFDGSRFLVEFAALNAVHKTESAELGALVYALGGSHVVGLEAYGASLWVALAGTGEDVPKIVEVVVD